ncbi:MAG: Trm112 family protein [Calditrichaeota bacterium]|nr:MAG: Trm112 family protein [Calditrichota bacterium]MBL1204349.1 Trm112 family protein [Calditrichota bacterium]NOG44178.1 Trm112 family protein [Calditrichota bacterium]
MDKKLLDILCCPKTKVDVVELDQNEVSEINGQIEAGSLKYVEGKKVEKPLQEGLITKDKKTVYRIDDDIPIMLIEMGIPMK